MSELKKLKKCEDLEKTFPYKIILGSGINEEVEEEFGSDIKPIEIGNIEFNTVADHLKMGSMCDPLELKFHLISQDEKPILIIQKACKSLGTHHRDWKFDFEAFELPLSLLKFEG